MTVKERVAQYLGTNEAGTADLIAATLGLTRLEVLTALWQLRDERRVSPPTHGVRAWRIVLKRGERAYPTG